MRDLRLERVLQSKRYDVLQALAWDWRHRSSAFEYGIALEQSGASIEHRIVIAIARLTESGTITEADCRLQHMPDRIDTKYARLNDSVKSRRQANRCTVCKGLTKVG